MHSFPKNKHISQNKDRHFVKFFFWNFTLLIVNVLIEGIFKFLIIFVQMIQLNCF